jgi:hypothetical protein
MELKKVNILNKGMSQDYSISKDNQEYAFENKNIRIQALDDSTLLSVTNVKGPKKIQNITIQGIIVGKCFTGDYLILFTTTDNSKIKKDRIYRINIKNTENIETALLFEGYLGFELDRTFDTCFYKENNKI